MLNESLTVRQRPQRPLPVVHDELALGRPALAHVCEVVHVHEGDGVVAHGDVPLGLELVEEVGQGLVGAAGHEDLVGVYQAEVLQENATVERFI